MRLRSWVQLISGGTVILLGLAFLLDSRSVFLPGKTSDGHYVLETSCNSCHVAFASVTNEGCIACHRSELQEDTHALKIFDDPRWAATLESIDALHCRTCHAEHAVADQGVTVGREFCFPCHDDVVSKRANHRDFEPSSCWNAGCHNYHDNRALNSSFLAQRLGDEATRPHARVLDRSGGGAGQSHSAPVYPAGLKVSEEILAGWDGSLHAAVGVNCLDCHRGEKEAFVNAPGEKSCARCHGFEVDTFHQGKHGVRTSLGLSPLAPAEARLPMKSMKHDDRKLSCSACHDPHTVDTRKAAVEACLACHDDPHSRSFPESKHFALFTSAPGARPGPEAVTCATCHLPRTQVEVEGKLKVAVNHNNTYTLEPLDRMVKDVCLSCHGIEFSMNSIFDERLALNNFQGEPAKKHETITMIEALRRKEQASSSRSGGHEK